MLVDSYLWMVLPGIALGVYAQVKLMNAYSRYSEEPVESGISGAEAAREILDRAGLNAVEVAEVPGHLTDHYDPTKRALFLSSDNYHGRSLAAVGVAAHEAGHALQHKDAYAPMRLRSALVPVTNIASTAVYVIVLLGMFLGIMKFIKLAVVAFAIITLFQLVTLPVEYDASRRAKEKLARFGLIRPGELKPVSAVLNAAALTYVAALVASLFELLRFAMLARNDRD